MIAIIGGSGLTHLSNLDIVRREVVRTPYGEPSGALQFGHLCNQQTIFIARHGYGHTIPPHRINYRAQLEADNLRRRLAGSPRTRRCWPPSPSLSREGVAPGRDARTEPS